MAGLLLLTVAPSPRLRGSGLGGAGVGGAGVGGRQLSFLIGADGDIQAG